MPGASELSKVALSRKAVRALARVPKVEKAAKEAKAEKAPRAEEVKEPARAKVRAKDKGHRPAAPQRHLMGVRFALATTTGRSNAKIAIVGSFTAAAFVSNTLTLCTAAVATAGRQRADQRHRARELD